MHHMRMAFNLKFLFTLSVDAFTASTPSQSCCNSSIKGARYTSTFSDVTLSFPGMRRTNIKKNHFVTIHGGRL
jgi:hypothetical protein